MQATTPENKERPRGRGRGRGRGRRRRRRPRRQRRRARRIGRRRRARRHEARVVGADLNRAEDRLGRVDDHGARREVDEGHARPLRGGALVDPHGLRAHLELDEHTRARADEPLLLDEHAQHAPGRRNHVVVDERARLSLGDGAAQPGVRVVREVVAAFHLGDEHAVRSQGIALLHHNAAPIRARPALADRLHALSGQPRREDVAGGSGARPNVGVARRARERIAPRGGVTVGTVAARRASFPHAPVLVLLRFARFFRRSHRLRSSGWLRSSSRQRPALVSLDFARLQRRTHSHSLGPVRRLLERHRSAAHRRLALVS